MIRTLALALVLLAACTGSGNPADAARPATPAQPGQPAEPASPSPAVTGALRITDGAGATGPFKLGDVSRLSLEGRCASVAPGAHTLRVDVVSPNGTIYASVPEDVVVPESGAVAVSRKLQVRGTNIETFRRAGVWRFTLTLDGGEPVASADVDLTE